MRTLGILLVAIIVITLVGRHSEAEELGTVVAHASADGAPLEGVTFLLVGPDAQRLTAVSNRKGEAAFLRLPPGDHTLVAVYGDQQAQAPITVTSGGVEDHNFVFRPMRGEVIRIEEPLGPSKAAPAAPKKKLRVLEYSDELIDQNLYGVVWMMLDVDPTGAVTRATVLKAPRGLGLEEIAVRECRKMRFDPARNHAGDAIASSVVIVLEWPPFWAKGEGFAMWSACAGSGPLHLDLADNHVLAYKDCEPPPGFEHMRYQSGHDSSSPRDIHRAWKGVRKDPTNDIDGPIVPLRH